MPRHALTALCLLALAACAAAPVRAQSLPPAPPRAALRYGPLFAPPGEAGARTAPLSKQREDRWLARDKAKHVAATFLVTLSVQYALTRGAGWSKRGALPLAVGTGVLVSLSKELYDWKIGPTQHFSGRDLAADAAGIALAVGVITL